MKSWDMTRGLGAGVTLGVAVALACLGGEGLAAQGVDIRRDATVIAVEAVLPSVSTSAQKRNPSAPDITTIGSAIFGLPSSSNSPRKQARAQG